MADRVIALLVDDAARARIDLVRALYDRGAVDVVPPHVPLVGPAPLVGALSAVKDIIALLVGAHQPFMLELGAAERVFDGSRHLLQLVAGQGAEDSRRLAAALAGDLQGPQALPAVAAARIALTVGSFESSSAADKAAVEFADRRYFVVVSQVGILEEREDGAWSLERTLALGSIREDGA